MNAPLILFVEDEQNIRQFVSISLNAEGYRCVTAADGVSAQAKFRDVAPDLVILDLGLPDLDGVHLLGLIRQVSNVPVLILTARDEEEQKVRLLMAGANDYLCKPFSLPELIARVHVLLRDAGIRAASAASHFEGFTIDRQRRTVSVDEHPVALSPKEFAVLDMLAAEHGNMVLQQDLLKAVWGPSHARDTHYLRVLFTALRKKLGDSADTPRFIKTIPGTGYIFVAPLLTQ